MPALVPKRLLNLKICFGFLKGVQYFALTKKKKTAETKAFAKQGDPGFACCCWRFAERRALSFFRKDQHSEVDPQHLRVRGIMSRGPRNHVPSHCKRSHVVCVFSLHLPYFHTCPFSSSPPTQPVTATRWARLARRATRPQDSAPARTASLASPATAAPRATSRAARRWLPASVSSSHDLSV